MKLEDLFNDRYGQYVSVVMVRDHRDLMPKLDALHEKGHAIQLIFSDNNTTGMRSRDGEIYSSQNSEKSNPAPIILYTSDAPRLNRERFMETHRSVKAILDKSVSNTRLFEAIDPYIPGYKAAVSQAR